MLEDRTAAEAAEFSIDLTELDIGPSHVAAAMGYRDAEVPDPYVELIRGAIREAEERTRLRAGFRILPPGSLCLHRDAFALAGVRFEAGRIIARELAGSTTLAIFAATAGQPLDDWVRAHFERNDLVHGFVIDALGSEIAEATANWIDGRVAEAAAALELSCTNRVSPGYCGWPVAEQHKLFSLLPEGFAGIRLTEASLMIPIKSVSGIVGLGPGVVRADHPCRVCDLDDCYRRRVDFEE